MPSYDPQRNRPRQRPKEDEPAPVDALLGEPTTADRLAVPADASPPAAPPEVYGDDLAHVHGADCDHGPDPALALGVAVLSAAGGLLLAARWLRRRRRRPDG